jgi:division protein CdvB (Snf7/Vps24/ESCRT-III family)
MVERHQLVTQINNANAVVYNQLGRLKVLDSRFASMEVYYLEQITTNIKTGNNTRAKVMANELSNLRKIRRTTQHTGMALEALVIRFSTINEFALVLDTIDPTVEMIKGIQADIAKAIPSASQTFSEVSAVTIDVLANANVKADVRVTTMVDSDALNILNQIEGQLESEAKAKLPEIPANMPAHEVKEEQKQAVMVEG